MLTVFDEIKNNMEKIIDFTLACSISFGREVLDGTFKEIKDEDFKKVIIESYDKAMHSDLCKYKMRKHIRKALLQEVEGEKE